MANSYFIGGPLGGTYQSLLEDVSDDYYFWKTTRNGVLLFVHGPGSPLATGRLGFLEDLPFMVKDVTQELTDRGGHPETLDIDIKPEVMPGAYGELDFIYRVNGTALGVS